MTTRLIKDVINLIADKDFQALGNRCISSSLLERLTFDENKKSDVLAWLFDPKEGHLQSDYFLRALLNAVYSNAENTHFEYLPSGVDIALTSLVNIQVVRELAIENHNNKKFIDLFLIDPYQKLVITIERKDGSYAHSNQLAVYADWVQHNYIGWKHIFVLLDSESRNHKQHDPRYVQLDDNWLCDALLDITDKGRVSEYLERQFRDIHDFIFGDWDEKRDRFYTDFDKKLKSVAKTHCETLRLLEQYSVSLQNIKSYLLDITPSIYYTKILPNRELLTEEAQQLLALTQQYYAVFSLVHGLNEFDELEEKLIAGLGFKVETELHSNVLYFTHKKHYFGKGCWPVCFGIERIENESDEVKYIFTLLISKYADEEYHAFVEKVAAAYGLSFKKNQKKLQLIKAIEFDELVIKPHSPLLLCLQEHLDKISRINI
ncbi:hypothetical protein PALB_8630 [Pseudoalteromonas luteoviolacea B = ATCC 29581]|nr:hypothetical protein PALB_8630 [Pseudoalteromonas luteoviolacea B = ATCC 29581]